jgi:thiamine kinase-like enzyme
MPPDDIERLCRAIVPGTGAVEVYALAKGLISETHRVVRDGVTYALKAPVPQRADFGLDLAWEAQVLERAGSLGLAPPLVYCDPKRAVLSRWVVGRSWSPPEARRAANIAKIAELLRRVHALSVPLPPRVMSPMSWIQVYGAALPQHTRGGALDGALRRAAESCLNQLAELPAAAGVVCHSDLHAMNLIQVDEALTLLDWEYTHVSDPLWDLAGWAANNDFEPETQRGLLVNYLGIAPTAAQWKRFRLTMWLYDYVCLLWSELYLNMRRDTVNGTSRRATLLDARLRLPAHYAA